MLTWEYPPRIVGGLSRAVEGLSEALVKQGVEVWVITLPHPGTGKYEVINGVKVIRAKSHYQEKKDFLSSVQEFNFTFLESALSRIKLPSIPHIIHSHDWLCAYSAFVLKYGYKRPLIATIHATEHGRNHGIYTDMQRYIHSIELNLVNRADRVITCSDFMKEEVVNLFGLRQEKVISIPNGINKDKYHVEFDKRTFRRNYAPDNEKIIFYVGRLVREKGLEVLIDAAPLILKDRPESKFLIVGSGGEITSLKRKVQYLGIEDKFYFTGYVDDDTLTKIYNVVDVAVFPSLYEPFGIVALEALAAGVPVVVSDTGGFREIIQQGVNGICTEVGNPLSLSEGILSVIKNLDYSNSLKKEGRKKIIEIYSWEKIAQGVMDVYEEVISFAGYKA